MFFQAKKHCVFDLSINIDLKTMEKELNYTNNKLISKLIFLKIIITTTVINKVYLNMLCLLISQIHSVSLLEKKNHQLVHKNKNNKDMFS